METHARANLPAPVPFSRAAWLAIALLWGVGAAHAQEREGFEAAVIRKAAAPGPVNRLTVTPAGMQAQAASLRYLVSEANGLTDYEIEGATGWMESELYSLSATAGQATERPQMMLLLRRLLAQRFHLKARQEARPANVFSLEVAPGGHKLPPLPEGAATLAPGMVEDYYYWSMGSSVEDLVRHLNTRTGAASLGRLVVNRTGLTGRYHIRLKFEVETNPDGRSGRFAIDYPTAVAAQLGLRLKPAKLPVTMLVVESAARPEVD